MGICERLPLGGGGGLRTTPSGGWPHLLPQTPIVPYLHGVVKVRTYYTSTNEIVLGGWY